MDDSPKKHKKIKFARPFKILSTLAINQAARVSIKLSRLFGKNSTKTKQNYIKVPDLNTRPVDEESRVLASPPRSLGSKLVAQVRLDLDLPVLIFFIIYFPDTEMRKFQKFKKVDFTLNPGLSA